MEIINYKLNLDNTFGIYYNQFSAEILLLEYSCVNELSLYLTLINIIKVTLNPSKSKRTLFCITSDSSTP